MLRSLDDLIGFNVSTADGALGILEDVYYDDLHWTVRYLVVGAIEGVGTARLISPYAVERLSDEAQQIHLRVDLARVMDAPDVTERMPASLAAEMEYHDFFGWPYYWQGPYAWGMLAVPAVTGPAPAAGPLLAPDPGKVTADEEADTAAVTPAAGTESAEVSHHLHSAVDTIGYHVQALDGEIGHVQDFLLDDGSWSLASVVIDTRNWWVGKKVAIPSREFTRIDWTERLIFVDQDREQVKAEREFDMDTLPRED